MSCCRISNCFFRVFIKNNLFHGYDPVKCDVVTGVLGQNEILHQYFHIFKTFTNLKKDVICLH